ncbi:MAG: hypothetical protein V3W08_07140 [Candidatus Binatia bacterium]|jgi:hypothetical protein
MIPTIALIDRTFQKRRLLEGKTTVNIGLKTQLVEAAEQHNDKDIDVTPTKTKEAQEDKPTE